MSYATTQQHLLAELARVDTLLEACDPVETTNDASSDRESPDRNPSDDTPTVGASTDAEPTADPDAHTLRPRELPLAVPAEGRRRVAEHTDRIDRRCRETTDVRLRLRVLADVCDLSRRHLDVLLLALAPRLDEAYHTTFQRLHNRDSVAYPTEILLEALFATTPSEQLAAGALVASDSPLRRHDLIELQSPPDPTLGDRGRLVTVSDRIVDYCKGYDGVDPHLDAILADHATGRTTDGLETVEATKTLDSLSVDDELRDRLADLESDANAGRRYYFHGPATEKRHAVEAVCSGERLIKADLAAVLAANALEWLRREAALLGRPLWLSNATAATTASRESTVTLEAVFDALSDLETDVFVTGSESWMPTERMATEVEAIIEFPYPSVEVRRDFWAARAAELPESVDPDVLAGTFRLTVGQLRAALSTARSLADGEEMTAADICAGCNAQSADGLDDLAHRIEPDSDWEEIQLRPDTERKLRLVRTHIAQQARIYGEWGFAESFSRGTGVVALFEGPSGTGKTMAAEILAGDVGMDLYRIDLSSVVSKYIGETEENLEEIFEAATNSNAILLFDEADAVFGDRAEVSDATDRYANAEVNYLLQRIERYDGVVLLTTNYASQIDSAFQRRLDHTVSFKAPQQSTRTAIWKGVFPAATPLGDLDYEFLASFEFTGGEIKQIAQTAAVLAADDAAADTPTEGCVEMRHLVGAIQLAFESSGRMVDPSVYEPYQDLCADPSDGAVGDARATSDHDGTPAAPDHDGTTAAPDHEDETDVEPADTSPEGTVRRLFDRLRRGDSRGLAELYHPRAVVDPPSRRERRRLAYGEVSISGEIDRRQDAPDRVVLGFVRSVDGTHTRVDYELRPDDGVWRIFNRHRRSEPDRPASR